MGAQVYILLWTEIFGVPIILIAFTVWVFLLASRPSKAAKGQKWAHEKVVELTEKGHDAKICPKCNGKAAAGEFWVKKCAECNGLGYIYKLRHSEEGPPNANNKAGLKKCANCGRTIGKLEKSYVFEGQTVCGQCHQRLESQK